MVYRVFHRQWVVNPAWFSLTLGAVIILALLALWQMERAEQKTLLLKKIARLAQAPSASIPSVLIDGALIDGAPIHLRGRWLAPMVWLVDNQLVDGRIGYDVVAPYQPIALNNMAAQNPVLLVNLGWVEAPLERNQLPPIVLPAELTIEGLVRVHTGGLLLGQNLEDRGSWPMRIQRVEVQALQTYINFPLLAGLVYQSGDSPFRTHYRPVVISPARHQAYALQWALLAFALVVIALSASLQREDQPVARPVEQGEEQHD